jgi:proteasome lid subunit RPN8/RPN11
VAQAPAVRYRIDPREQLAAFRSMDAAGEDLLVIYHSHPASVPYPSPTDRAEAFYPDAAYVLVSLRSGDTELRAFRIEADAPGSEKAVREIEIAG